MRQVANDPEDRMLAAAMSFFAASAVFHFNHARVDSPKQKVRKPVRVLYCRAVSPGPVEVVRVSHAYGIKPAYR